MYFSSCFIHSIGEWLELRRIIHLRFDLLKKTAILYFIYADRRNALAPVRVNLASQISAVGATTAIIPSMYSINGA